MEFLGQPPRVTESHADAQPFVAGSGLVVEIGIADSNVMSDILRRADRHLLPEVGDSGG